MAFNKPYYEIIREERNFVALLYGFLMNPEYLGKFLRGLKGIKGHLLEGSRFESAEVYVEFSYLRDLWNDIGKSQQSNDKKEKLIWDWLEIDTSDRQKLETRIREYCKKEDYKKDLKFCLNLFGSGSQNHVESPSNWRLNELDKFFDKQVNDNKNSEANKILFRKIYFRMCMLKWSFNCKPDLVILLPEKEKYGKGICIEAKWDSRVDKYPSDKGNFSKIFNTGQNDIIHTHPYQGYLKTSDKHTIATSESIKTKYVTQLSLQEYMFNELIEWKNMDFYTLSKDHKKENGVIIWGDVFEGFDIPSEYVEKILKKVPGYNKSKT